jgi:8-oxo-dGTP pyrophosphatase MutT (NUDIX family)
VELFGVGALLYTKDGRYLMQLRDDRPEVSMRGQWGLFGGVVEKSERPARALARELMEELSYAPRAKPLRFAEISWELGFAGQGTHAKTLFAVPVDAKALRAMRLGEGKEMRLFTLARLLATRNVVPWDAFAVTLFARRALVKARVRRYRPAQLRRSR